MGRTRVLNKWSISFWLKSSFRRVLRMWRHLLAFISLSLMCSLNLQLGWKVSPSNSRLSHWGMLLMGVYWWCVPLLSFVCVDASYKEYWELMLPPKSIETLVLTALTLHNYLMQNSSSHSYCPTGLCDREIAGGTTVQGSWCQDISSESFLPLQVPPCGHNSSTDAKMVRETFKDFFFHEGAVTWQWDKC